MTYPKVSIIIPSHNKESYIYDAVDSALQQTYKNIEIIIVDDNSTDRTKIVLGRFDDSKINIYFKNFNSASLTRNYALTKCTGSFIQYLDADDILHPSKIERQLNDMDFNEDALGVCNTKAFYNNIDDEGKEVDTEFLNYSPNPFHFLINIYSPIDSGMVQPNAWLASKKLIGKSGEWNKNLSVDDDGEFFCRVILQSSKIVHTNKILNYYRKFRKSNNNLSAQISSKAYRSMLDSAMLKKRHLENYLIKHNLKYNIVPITNVLFLNIMIQTFPLNMHFYNEAKSFYNNQYPTKIPILGGKSVELFKSVFGWKFTRRVLVFFKSKIIR